MGARNSGAFRRRDGTQAQTYLTILMANNALDLFRQSFNAAILEGLATEVECCCRPSDGHLRTSVRKLRLNFGKLGFPAMGIMRLDMEPCSFGSLA